MRLAQLQRHFPLLQILALMALFAYGAATLPGLASWPSIKSILVLAALIGLASAGQTLLILMGGFDLSVSGFIVAGGTVEMDERRFRHGEAILDPPDDDPVRWLIGKCGAVGGAHDRALTSRSFRARTVCTGEERAWRQAMCHGRHPAVPRFAVNFDQTSSLAGRRPRP